MTTENLIQSSTAPVRATTVHEQFSEIAHELKNCVSVLLLTVEIIAIDREHGVPHEDSIEDLKNLMHKVDCLVERLISL